MSTRLYRVVNRGKRAMYVAARDADDAAGIAYVHLHAQDRRNLTAEDVTAEYLNLPMHAITLEPLLASGVRGVGNPAFRPTAERYAVDRWEFTYRLRTDRLGRRLR